MITKAQANETYSILNSEGIQGGLTGQVKLIIHDELGNTVGVQDLYNGIEVDEDMMNQSLDTAKIIFSRLAGGDISYKVAKIAFGNAGHNFDNPKQAVAALSTDEELSASMKIKASLNETADKHFLYTHTNLDGSTTTYRMVYIEKDILAENITYGANGNQFIVRVPISYDEFNGRVGDATGTEVMYKPETVGYRLINTTTGDLMTFEGVDASGVPTGDFSEVYSWDDNGTRRYTFMNGINSSGVIDTVNGGYRPQEISEILLCADITGDGSVDDPYKKYATSRMTSGLLSFPEGFTFTYEWTLSWNFPAA